MRNKYVIGLERFVAVNHTQILTGLGVAGVVTTAVLTGKASVKAFHEISDAQVHPNGYDAMTVMEDLTKVEVVKRTWKYFIPALATGSLTIYAIISSNRIGTRRAAAMASAYALSEKAYSEYKDKIVQTIGEKKEQKVRDEIQQDRVNSSKNTEVIIAGSGETLCYDSLTDRFFKSSMEEIKKAQNDLNYQLLHDSYASLTDFYNKVGLSPTSMSDDIGWNSDRLVELVFSSVLVEEKAALAFSFATAPVPNFYKAH